MEEKYLWGIGIVVCILIMAGLFLALSANDAPKFKSGDVVHAKDNSHDVLIIEGYNPDYRAYLTRAPGDKVDMYRGKNEIDKYYF
jgi:hypothetical protein